eukprot:5753241-Pleurochrysis_carterae.AAC.1
MSRFSAVLASLARSPRRQRKRARTPHSSCVPDAVFVNGYFEVATTCLGLGLPKSMRADQLWSSKVDRLCEIDFGTTCRSALFDELPPSLPLAKASSFVVAHTTDRFNKVVVSSRRNNKI